MQAFLLVGPIGKRNPNLDIIKDKKNIWQKERKQLFDFMKHLIRWKHLWWEFHILVEPSGNNLASFEWILPVLILTMDKSTEWEMCLYLLLVFILFILSIILYIILIQFSFTFFAAFLFSLLFAFNFHWFKFLSFLSTAFNFLASSLFSQTFLFILTF